MSKPKTPERTVTDDYIEEVLRDYSDTFITAGTLHLHVIDYMQEDSIPHLKMPSLDDIYAGINLLVDRQLVERKNIFKHGGTCHMFKAGRKFKVAKSQPNGVKNGTEKSSP